ncbi:GNAT family N-acetyltransferase [Acetobacter sp.]|jgi:GNAT superfamily N-acetyltransferase|uniref:GNAT family N-acetyltransferase n=1 Tax=Acetobacter sp. TaxID=440 RepID=UPI0025B8AF5E|nr:GNAT family N-acetyltransferase [Acetobacter sp.]MCH4090009.1 GNAT family N-acetyltransferase [Acetobacter sp.]MCI1298705.1 GNAT family N-acetyltransferase [Acetobacter sp.]MCI1315270.1 GNAT family N-acetyltransferase [Acetobacter sp.]
MNISLVIRNVEAADEGAWRRLWAGYNRFYEAAVPADVTGRTWERLLDAANPLFCRVAEKEGEVIGFTNSVLHEGTWVNEPICYLEDLFVTHEARGNGVGRALIRDLVDLGRKQGWSRLYWHTRENNPARRLYDEFVQADDFVRYRMDL